MSDDNKQLLTVNISGREITAHDLAASLKYMIVGGKKLEDHEVFALTQFCVSNNLNPFANEAYYLPGTGPIAGIVGYRKRAKEECNNDAIKAGYGYGEYWIDYFQAETTEAIFIPGKDIAIKAVLHDSITNKRWRQEIIETMRSLKECGVSEAYQEACRLVGSEPVWVGYAVVFESEKFASDGKVEKYDRVERCRKRAEKQATKKRFPNLVRDEAQGDYDDTEPNIVVEKTAIQPETKKPDPLMVDAKSKTPDEISKEIGF